MRFAIPSGHFVADRRLAAVRFYSNYWHNVSAGVVHGSFRFAAVPEGLAADDPAVPCGTVERVRVSDLHSAGCNYRQSQRSNFGAALGSLSPLGGPGSATLDRPDLDGTAWEPVVVGPDDARVWRKLPSPLP